MEAVNSAFLSKLAWKLFHNQSLWVEQMQAKYQIDKNFFVVEPKRHDSWAWKCILKNWQQFRKWVKWQVGNGANINSCRDNWCTNDSLTNLLKVLDLALINTSLKVSQFITKSREWDVVRLTALVDSIYLQLIFATPIPSNSISDSVCWRLSSNGQFSTKTATWAAHGLDLVNPPVWEYNWIWKLDVMPKQKFFFGNFAMHRFALEEPCLTEVWLLILAAPFVNLRLKI